MTVTPPDRVAKEGLMQISPARVPKSTRCLATDSVGIAARVQAATWTCATCGVIAPHVDRQAGYVYVHAAMCACQRDALRDLRVAEAMDRAVATRDRLRIERALAGMEPGMRVWHQRFATFQAQVQQEAYDVCVHWTRLMVAMAERVRGGVEERSQQRDGRRDPVTYQMLWRPAWLASLSEVPNVVLLGGTGTGKTHLCVSVFHALIDADLCPIYAPGMALLDQIRERWDRDDPDQTEEQLMKRLIAAEVLILDGPDMSSRPWSVARWFRLLDGRAAHGRPTVVAGTSERRLVSALGIEGYDRLCDHGCVLTLRGGSYRRRQMFIPAQILSLPVPVEVVP